jgi:hypothetical protein
MYFVPSYLRGCATQDNLVLYVALFNIKRFNQLLSVHNAVEEINFI